MKKILYLSLTILLVTLLSQSAYAQDKDKDPGKLHFSIAPYFWVLNIDGTNTVGSVEVPLDVGIGDIFDALKFAGLGHFEIKQNKWGALIDINYLRVGEDNIKLQPATVLPLPDAFANFRLALWILEFMGSYRIVGSMDSGLELLLGVRWMRHNMDLDVTLGPIDLPGGYDEDWLEPVIGARYYGELGSKWFTSLRGDIGGFQSSSKFSYTLAGFVGYHISHVVDIVVGYKLLDILYSNEKEGRGLFKFDGTLSGILVGLNFRL